MYKISLYKLKKKQQKKRETKRYSTQEQPACCFIDNTFHTWHTHTRIYIYICVCMCIHAYTHTLKYILFLIYCYLSTKLYLQIIMLIPLWIQRVSHSICRVALSWAIYHYFGKGIWQTCETRQREVERVDLVPRMLEVLQNILTHAKS